MVQVKTHSSGEMTDAEHASEGISVFHGRRAYAQWAGRERCKSAAFIEKCSAAVRLAPNPHWGISVRSEAERLGRDAYFDEERAECASETDHGGDEQDGYGSRQVDGDERGCEK